jgi:hypothetical protein
VADTAEVEWKPVSPRRRRRVHDQTTNGITSMEDACFIF